MEVAHYGMAELCNAPLHHATRYEGISPLKDLRPKARYDLMTLILLLTFRTVFSRRSITRPISESNIESILRSTLQVVPCHV